MFKLSLYILAVAAILALIIMPIPASAEETAKIELQPSKGPVGTKVHITGEGFEAETKIVISFKTKDNKLGEVDTDEEGCFDTCFTVEECPVGVYGVWATGVSEGKTVEASSLFTVVPEITLSKSSGYVGDEITVTGTGFAAEKAVTIYFDNAKVKVSKTNAKGTFGEFTLQIPKSYGGKHTIKAVDADKNSDSASFSIKQLISINPKSGPIGTKVTIGGTGFAAKKDITIYFDEDKVGESKTDAAGTFANVSFHIPRSYNGKHTIKAKDTDRNFDNAFFSTTQSISLNPKLRSVGTKVTISGTGFKANSDVITIFDGEQVASDSTDRNGSFTGTFIVPLRPNGIYYNIKASDGTNVAYADCTIGTSASLSKTSGHVGMKLDINGASFSPNETVTVNYDKIKVATATINSDATFSASFIVPKIAHGDHTITATDGTNTIELVFTVESTPPPVPELVLPESGSKTEGQAYFDWNNVEDPSGVTYTLQVASNATFPNPSVLSKKGLTNSEYTIAAEEQLKPTEKKAPYYWRVRAIDSASNVGKWSTPRSFYVGHSFAMPPWTKHSLIGLGIVLFSFLGFYAGRSIFYHRFRKQPLEQGENEVGNIAQ